MKKRERERLQKFYSTLSDTELRQMLILDKREYDQGVYSLLKEEIERRERDKKRMIFLAEKEHPLSYASCIRRGLATLIDVGIITIPFIPFFWQDGFQNLYTKIFSAPLGSREYYLQGMTLVLFLDCYYAAMFLVYGTFFLGKMRCTVGQYFMRLRVFTYAEQPLSYKQAFFRGIACLGYFIPYIGGVFILISMIMIFTNKRKQALHDVICKTLVLNEERR